LERNLITVFSTVNTFAQLFFASPVLSPGMETQLAATSSRTGNADAPPHHPPWIRKQLVLCALRARRAQRLRRADHGMGDVQRRPCRATQAFRQLKKPCATRAVSRAAQPEMRESAQTFSLARRRRGTGRDTTTDALRTFP
jgi:hypothetical protein